MRLFCSLFALVFLFATEGRAQGMRPLDEGNVEIMGHSLGLGFNYRRTLDVSYRNEWHGLVSAGITNGMYSIYFGMGYRRGTDWFVEPEIVGGYNGLFGLRLDKEATEEIKGGISFGAHLNWGSITIHDYSIRITTGYHIFQENHGQFILAMQVGRFF